MGGEADKPLTLRGFRVYLDRERPPSNLAVALGIKDLPASIRVIESSKALEGPHVRIYGAGDDHVQLSYDEARAVRDALEDFIMEAKAGELTERLPGG